MLHRFLVQQRNILRLLFVTILLLRLLVASAVMRTATPCCRDYLYHYNCGLHAPDLPSVTAQKAESIDQSMAICPARLLFELFALTRTLYT